MPTTFRAFYSQPDGRRVYLDIEEGDERTAIAKAKAFAPRYRWTFLGVARLKRAGGAL